MLHEAIFLATCNATNVALQVARKNSRVTPHFATAIVALRVARKVQRPSTFRNLRDKLLACNIPSATCNAILSEWANQSSSLARCRRLSVSAILFVTVRVASCEKSCKRVTPPLQLERFFIRHRCVASCKKNCLVLHGLKRNVLGFYHNVVTFNTFKFLLRVILFKHKIVRGRVF